jgi:hypothetical protein
LCARPTGSWGKFGKSFPKKIHNITREGITNFLYERRAYICIKTIIIILNKLSSHKSQLRSNQDKRGWREGPFLQLMRLAQAQ